MNTAFTIGAAAAIVAYCGPFGRGWVTGIISALFWVHW